MNKVYRFFIAVIIGIGALLFMRFALEKKSDSSTKNTLYVYNWGDYISPEVVKHFEDETGIKVVMETFDSNEAMITKIKQKSTDFDICVPSEYAVEMMRDQGLLKKLDHSKIEGLENIDPRFLDREYDPGNEYSIPYFWGTFGIVYDKSKYNEKDFKSWKNLWDDKFKGEILAFDGARETLGIGLLAKNMSLNTTDEDTLIKTRDELRPFMGNIKAILADEIRMYMSQGEASVGLTFNGDASIAIESNDKLGYAIPEEGSNIWFDNLVIPETSKNTEGAYAFISFLNRAEEAATNADYIWYATVNKKAMDLIDDEARDDKTLYPDEDVVKKLEVFKALDKESTILYNDLFLDLKISPQSK